MEAQKEKQLIEEGLQLATTVDRAQLRLGKLCLEFAPMGERGLQTGAMGRVELYADSINMDPAQLAVYRSVAHAWSNYDVKEGEFKYSLLRQLTAVVEKEKVLKILRDDIPEGGWTLSAAMEAVKDYLPKEKAGGRKPDPRKQLHTVSTQLINMEVKNLHQLTEAKRKEIREELGIINDQIGRIEKALRGPAPKQSPANGTTRPLLPAKDKVTA